jgi:adenylate cyclase
MGVERRLAAVLAADVVGYSRLMGTDELGTLRILNEHHLELVEPSIAAYKGRIVKTTGDGILVEFAGAVDAVACAMHHRLWRRHFWGLCQRCCADRERV